MNGIYKDPLEESYDDFIDDEAVGTTAEFNPFGVVSSIGSTIGGFLGGGGRKQPVQQVRDQRTSPAPGVRDARLEVPGRGSANLRLPEAVVSQLVFNETTSNLQEGINKVALGVNSLEQKD